MYPRWRLLQFEYDKKARAKLAAGGDTRFRAWEATVMFYGIVIILDGYAEMSGLPVPKTHRARRAVVERRLPRLVDLYDDLYSLSLEARYYDGHAMTERAWREAERCYEALARSIPISGG